MNARRSITLAPMALVLLLAATARAENEGLADLDQATEAKLMAANFKDLTEVIRLTQSALDKGLDKDNTEFAQQLLSATLHQRGSILASAIFSEDGPDPRWPKLRDAALADLERTLKIDAKQPDALLLIGRLHALPGGNRERAVGALDEFVRAEGTEAADRAKALTLRGSLQSDDEKRLADFNQAVKLAPDDVEAIRTRGLFYLVKEKLDLAVADLNKAVEIDPEHAATYEARGLALLAQKKFDDSLASFSKAIELAPDSATPYTHRARVQALKGNHQAAVKDLDKALEIDPGSLQVLLLRARVHQTAGDGAQALADVDQAIRMRPGFLPAQRLRAELLAGAGKIDEAIADLERLKQAQPTNSELLLQLGLYYLADKQPRRAIGLFDAVLAGEADNWIALRQRGDAQLSIGKQAAAMADYEAALKLRPEDSGLLNNLAWVLATSPDEKLRDGKQAINLATKACEATEFKQAHILSTLAAAYAETGDFEKAREWAGKAVEIGGEQKEQLVKELESYKAEKPWRELQTPEEQKPEEKVLEEKEPDANPPKVKKPEDQAADES